MTKINVIIFFAALLFAVCSFFWLDYPIAKWCFEQKCPKELRKIFQLSEVFGHFYGLIFTCLIVYVLDKKNRKNVPILFAAAGLAGLASSTVKLFVARLRPRAFDFSTSISDSFTGWFPFTHGGSAFQSFPSGHTALAVGLAVGLSRLYPQGRLLFAFFAVLVAMQRIVDSAHFPSDTIIGALVGYFVSSLLLMLRIPDRKGVTV